MQASAQAQVQQMQQFQLTMQAQQQEQMRIAQQAYQERLRGQRLETEWVPAPTELAEESSEAPPAIVPAPSDAKQADHGDGGGRCSGGGAPPAGEPADGLAHDDIQPPPAEAAASAIPPGIGDLLDDADLPMAHGGRAKPRRRRGRVEAAAVESILAAIRSDDDDGVAGAGGGAPGAMQ